MAVAVAVAGWAPFAAAQGTSGARIGSAGFNAGTLAGSVGGGPGLSGGIARDANRIRGIAPPADADESGAAAPAGSSLPPEAPTRTGSPTDQPR